MIYFLDTNVIIDLMNGNFNVLSAFKKAYVSEAVRIPDLVYYEVLRGFEYYDPKSRKSDFENFALRRGIEYMDLRTFKESAKQYARLKRYGLLIEDDDILIGSLAVVKDAVLVTNNTKHFSRIENIRLENWI